LINSKGTYDIRITKYYNDGIKDIFANIIRMTLFTRNAALKRSGLGHGLATIDDNGNKKSSNEIATQAYKLFREGNKPIENFGS
jgi:hypothetical protein